MNSRASSISIKCFLLLAAFLGLLAIPQVLLAVPVQLVFEGTVRRIDGNFSVAPYGISQGSKVSFTVTIDLAKDGSWSDYSVYDSFYAKQTGGTRIISSSAEDTSFTGYRDTYNNQTHIQIGSGKEYNDWWSNQETLPAGQYFYVGQYFYGNGGIVRPSGYMGPYALVRYDLVLKSISSVVPIPGAVWLLAPAMAGLVGLRRRLG